MVQVGSQSRSITHKIRAMQLLREGVIGQVYHARGYVSAAAFRSATLPMSRSRRPRLGSVPRTGADEAIQQEQVRLQLALVLGTGNGDIGNQGVHEMDICAVGTGPRRLARNGHFQRRQVCVEGRPGDSQHATDTFDFGDAQMTFDVRNLPTPPEGLVPTCAVQTTSAIIFFGTAGSWSWITDGFQVYKSTAGNISGEQARGAGAGSLEKYEKMMDEKALEEDDAATAPHMKNFLDAIRARDHKRLHADIEIGARAAAFCHLANISYRIGRTLRLSQSTGRFVGADDANALLTRDYREPYVVPAEV